MKAHHADDGEKRQAVRELKLPFHFGLDTDEGFPYSGTIDFMDNKIDPATGTIEVRGVVRNEPRSNSFPAPGFASSLPVSGLYKATLVPDSCVLTDQDERYVLALGKGNVVLRRTISPGRLLDDGMRVVLAPPKDVEPLEPKDWIITEGMQRARVNYPVEPMVAGQPIR